MPFPSFVYLPLLLVFLLPDSSSAQFLIPSSHSPSSLSRRHCRCANAINDPPAPQAVALPFATPARAKAQHNRNQNQRKIATIPSLNAKRESDTETALLEMSQRVLSPFKEKTMRNNGGSRMGTVNSGGNDHGRRAAAKGTRNRHVAGHRQKRQNDNGDDIRNQTDSANGINQPVAPAKAVPEGGKCNSERIRQIIKKARGRNSGALKRNIQALAERMLGARFNVVCARSDFSYISNTEEFCQERVHGNTCYVFKQIARDSPFPEPPELNQFVRGFGAIKERGIRKKAAAAAT